MINAQVRYGSLRGHDTPRETGATIMTQRTATIERANGTPYLAYESPILLRAADAAPYDEDDAVMDSWLASLDTREFELILGRLAETGVLGSSALEFSA
jgi:hypothetical protein